MYWLKKKLFYTLIIGSLAIIPYTVSGEGSATKPQISEKESDEIAQRRGRGYYRGGRDYRRGGRGYYGRRYYRGYRRPYYRQYYRPYRHYRWGYPDYYRYRYYDDPYYYYYDSPRSGVYLQFRL